MRILFIGDVVGRSGREAVATWLPRLREVLRIDLAVVNAENASHGFGLAPDMASALFAAGADVITLGNHAWDRKEIIPYIAEHPRLLRPLNFPPGTPGAARWWWRSPAGVGRWWCRRWGGCSWTRWTARSAPPPDLLTRYRLGGTVAAILVDFHAEASSEKMAFAPFFDGQVSAVVGTHTHCPPPTRRCCRRHGVPVGCRDVGRLRQRDRHGEGRRDAAVLAQDAGRAAGAGRG